MFDCCGLWYRCGILNFCPDEKVTYHDVHKCTVYRKLFILKDPEFIQMWRTSNYEHVKSKKNTDFDELAKVAEKLYSQEELLSKVEIKTSTVNERVPKASSLFFKGIKFTIQGGKIIMTNVKVVAAKGDFELISWMHKDLVNYGIREKDGTTMFEQFVPTKNLKGWDLRKKCVEALDTYATEGLKVVETSGKVKQAVTSPYDIEVGHIIVWTNPSNKEMVFGKVFQLEEYMAFYIKPNGEEGFWSYETLDNLMPKGQIKVSNLEDIPEGIIFPER